MTSVGDLGVSRFLAEIFRGFLGETHSGVWYPRCLGCDLEVPETSQPCHYRLECRELTRESAILGLYKGSGRFDRFRTVFVAQPKTNQSYLLPSPLLLVSSVIHRPLGVRSKGVEVTSALSVSGPSRSRCLFRPVAFIPNLGPQPSVVGDERNKGGDLRREGNRFLSIIVFLFCLFFLWCSITRGREEIET